MDFEQTVAFLMQRLPMFSCKGSNALKPGLKNIKALCEALGNPQEQYPTIHVAGTNGKGSVCHMLATALQSNGYKTGLYTSPHLIDFRERFRINGQLVSKQQIVSFVEQNMALIEQIQPSYFELSVALAFQVFADEKVDVAIIEVGLGGRLDSTNIIRPELSVITQIGYDHMDILGNTLTQIAGEKAGIIKEDVPVVIGATQPETEEVFRKAALAKQAPICFADQIWKVAPKSRDSSYQYFKATEQQSGATFSIKTDMMGTYQKDNIQTLATAVQLLHRQGWRLPLDKVWESLARVKECSGLHGRWEIIHRRPNIILEVAHNKGGIAFLAENLKSEPLPPQGKLYILIGFVKDKDIRSLLPLLPRAAYYYFTQARIPRALDAGTLSKMALDTGLKGAPFTDIAQAVKTALHTLKEEDTLLVTGSFFIVGEAAACLAQQEITGQVLPKDIIN